MARPNKPWFRSDKNTWYATIDGKKISLGVRGKENKADAVRAWHRLMADGRTTPEARAEVPTLTKLVTAFLADAEVRLKPATVRGYRDFLNPFADQYGPLRADRLTPAQALAYARKPAWSNSTRHGFLSVLSITFRWAERTGLLTNNPLTHLSKPPMESRGASALVGDDDHDKLLNAAPAYFKPFLMLLHLTGARPGEVAAITAENFDEETGIVRLKEHKTTRHGKSRLIFLPAEAVALLKELKGQHSTGHLLRNRVGQPFTKNAIVHMMASLRKKTGVKGTTAYGYRHRFATDALANGVPDAQVAALMGHSGTTMLHRHYAHLTAKAQALRQALANVR
jgi:integrase/recombinase XerC